MKWSIQPYLGRGSGDLTWGDCLKNGSQPHISPILRCFNRKITKKLRATGITSRLFWSVSLPSCGSRQGPPLWNWGNFVHFGPLPTTLNAIWLKKVVPNPPFSYLGKVKKNCQLLPLIFFGESQKYERGGVFQNHNQCLKGHKSLGLSLSLSFF